MIVAKVGAGMVLRVVAVLTSAVAAHTSIKSCGADSDHLKVSSIVLDADAKKGPRKGNAFTITVQGELDEAHQHGTVAGSLNLKALKLVDEAIEVNQKYDFLPGLAKGPVTLTIGPFTFPRTVPGDFDFTGQLSIVNEKAEPVTCLDFDLKIPSILAADDADEVESASSVCLDSSKDHLTNIQSNTVDSVTTTTMDLDEATTKLDLKLDLNVKVPLLPAVTVKLTEIPISLSPALPAGQLKFVGYPSATSLSSRGAVDVTGDLSIRDGNEEQLHCVTFGASAVSV